MRSAPIISAPHVPSLTFHGGVKDGDTQLEWRGADGKSVVEIIE